MVAARIGIAAIGVGATISLLIGAVIAIAPDAQSSSTVASRLDEKTVVQAAAPRAVPQRAPARAAAKLQPAIAEGRRELGDSMFAVRAGVEVTVHFDTDLRRTRYDWKFEDVVRETLPIVFGADARVALDSIPAGEFASGGDLLTELPERGIDLPMPSGQTLRVWPVTRPGRDGPLVVAYRATSATHQ